MTLYTNMIRCSTYVTGIIRYLAGHKRMGLVFSALYYDFQLHNHIIYQKKKISALFFSLSRRKFEKKKKNTKNKFHIFGKPMELSVKKSEQLN